MAELPVPSDSFESHGGAEQYEKDWPDIIPDIPFEDVHIAQNDEDTHADQKQAHPHMFSFAFINYTESIWILEVKSALQGCPIM